MLTTWAQGLKGNLAEKPKRTGKEATMRILAIAVSGMTAARQRLSVAAENIVHMLDRAPRDQVFRARTATTTTAAGGGVSVRIGERQPAILPVANPDAIGATSLFAPNVDPAVEAVETIRARVAFAAAARLVSVDVERGRRLLDILDTEGGDRGR